VKASSLKSFLKTVDLFDSKNGKWCFDPPHQPKSLRRGTLTYHGRLFDIWIEFRRVPCGDLKILGKASLGDDNYVLPFD